MCQNFLRAFNGATSLLRVKNNQGNTAAHVATVAKRQRIGPGRQHVEKHEKNEGNDDDRKTCLHLAAANGKCK